jgi:hypothetical protein
MAREPLDRLYNGAAAQASAPPGLSMDIAGEDWDDLLTAVKTRLRLTVGDRPSKPGDLLQGPMGRVQASVLECVAALDQLHQAMKHEREQRLRLEIEVAEAQSALDDARAELIVAQA